MDTPPAHASAAADAGGARDRRARCFGIQALAGHPNTWLLTGITAGIVLLAGRDGLAAGLRRALGVGLLGAAIGAVALVPTALLTTLSVRSSALSPNDLFASAATPFDILAFGFQGAFAQIHDGSWNIYTNWYPDGTFALLEVAAYVGLPALGLAVGASRLRRSRPLLIAVAVLIAIPVVEAFRPEFLVSIPLLNGLRSPVRAYLPASLLLGVLAGMAVGRHLLGMRPKPSRSAWRSRSWPMRSSWASPCSRRASSTPSRTRSPRSAAPRRSPQSTVSHCPRCRLRGRSWSNCVDRDGAPRDRRRPEQHGPGHRPTRRGRAGGSPSPPVRARAKRQRRTVLVHQQGL